MGASFPQYPDARSNSPRYPLSQASRHSETSGQRLEPISQSKIQELRELQQQKQIINARYDEVKAEVIGKLQRGVPIQQGALSVRVVPRPFRYLSAKSLTPLLGKAEVERLKEQVEPSVYYYVEIYEAG
jgi:hypothetical protein